MSTPYEIPLSGGPQALRVPIGGVNYRFTLKWNRPASCWVLDIADASGTDLVCGVPLVTGIDLLYPFQYLGLGVQLFVQSDFDANQQPTYDSLGKTSRLFLVVP